MAGTSDGREFMDGAFKEVGGDFSAGGASSLASRRGVDFQIPIREIVSLSLLVVVSDMTIYRSLGYMGPAIFFSVAPILLAIGARRGSRTSSQLLLIAMLFAIAARLAWCGSMAAAIAGFLLLSCFSMSLTGTPPYITGAIVFSSRLIAAGLRRLGQYADVLSRFQPRILQAYWFAVTLPIAALVAFSAIFVLANPNLVKIFGDSIGPLFENLEKWVASFDFVELVFLLVATCITAGMLRPDSPATVPASAAPAVASPPVKSSLYAGYRNTLFVVIILFVVYLVFEFRTLWFKTFPKGFHYSGYAHEGAAWLTVALGLATVLLSVMFRGAILGDPRLTRLRTMAWIWSLENLLLAAAVFNRLFIYIGFNGMTRMRVVGILGVASVLVGFILVIFKIVNNRDFRWLIRRQLWTVTIAAYVYVVFPVDACVNRFNVQRIMAGDPAPSVQISVHPTSDEGLLSLAPLINCPDQTVRQGVRWMLYDQLAKLDAAANDPKNSGWTSYQIARERLHDQLRGLMPSLVKELDTARRADQLETFRQYAYQWY